MCVLGALRKVTLRSISLCFQCHCHFSSTIMPHPLQPRRFACSARDLIRAGSSPFTNTPQKVKRHNLTFMWLSDTRNIPEPVSFELRASSIKCHNRSRLQTILCPINTLSSAGHSDVAMTQLAGIQNSAR